MSAKIFVIGGPTASGKSALASGLARRLNGVVINGDSMQLYDGLPILAAQPSAEDRAAVPHRLYGTLAVDDPCTAARWRILALQEVELAIAQKKTPIIVGGTGFYLKTLLYGISPIPDIPPEIREQGIALQKKLGNPAFHAELAKQDPDTAAKLDAMNTQRVVRAWEVLEATGTGLAAWHSMPPAPPPAHLSFTMVTLLPPREILYRNCDARFDKMLQAGAMEEAKAFRALKKGPSPLDKTLGYPELCDYFDGVITLERAAEKARQSTRNYAKRQMTWFRNQIKPDLVVETPDAAQIPV